MKTIKGQLIDAIVSCGFDRSQVTVEYPPDEVGADYATPAAFLFAKKLKQPPVNIARELAHKLMNTQFVQENIDRVEVVEPGFINFYLHTRFLKVCINHILESGERYGQSNSGNGKKVQIEFISANPTGPLTLGNGRGGTYGDVLAHILNLAGYQVQREYYINDAGNQVKTLGLSLLAAAGAIEKRDEYYKGEYIQEWVNAHPDTEWALYIDDPEKLGFKVAQEFLENMIKPSVKALNVTFDHWFSEKAELHDSGAVQATLRWLKDHDLIYEHEGAQWMKTEQYCDEKDRVVITREGDPTYFLADIAYHKNKFDRGFDQVINVWGADHHGYIKRMRAGVEAIGHKDQLKIVIMQLVRLMEDGKEVRMSKRKGNFVTLGELIDEVGVDAVRWFFLMRSPDTHMDFDLTLAKEKSQKNPVFYVQYAYARLSSIIFRAAGVRVRYSSDADALNQTERALLSYLLRWPELLSSVAEQHHVHDLTHYIYELANKVQKFYETSRVIENEEVNSLRLDITRAARQVLMNALKVLGIRAPQKM